MPYWLVAFATHPVIILLVGGGIGTNVRYWLGRLIVELQGPDVRFPWATFFINVSGSLILGWVAATFLDDRNPNLRKWHLLLGTGFCGGFTTFSTFSYETMLLFLQGKRSLAILYSFGSVALGLLGVWLGVKIAGKS